MAAFFKKKRKTRTYFVTGTDTGVGKTLVSTALLEAVKQTQLSTAAVKPVAAGCEQTELGLRNQDALALQQHMSIELAYEQVNPIALKPPIAPHIAAAQEELEIDIEALAEHCRSVAAGADFMLIEGAGGWPDEE